MKRDYQKIKSLSDFSRLDPPFPLNISQPPECDPYFRPLPESQMILRMLVRPKYGSFRIPVGSLLWLRNTILEVARVDKILTGIEDSWCYVTVRRGEVITETDDEWHFDGASFRTDIIPERNYVWVSHTPMQYKLGGLEFPPDFDPCKHNLFSYAAKQLADQPIQQSKERVWYLVNPFCFHRRDPETLPGKRTFIRISFPDIEGRDINNTENPLLKTPAWGRDPVKSFRNNLLDY